MALKKVGYYIVKGKCVKVFSIMKRNRAGRLVTKKVNYKGKVLKKGTKVYKTKAECVKALKRKMNKGKSTRSKGKKHVKKSSRFFYGFSVIFGTSNLENLVFRLDESTIFTKSRFFDFHARNMKKYCRNRTKNYLNSSQDRI